MINSKGSTPIIVSISMVIIFIFLFSKTVTSTGYSPEKTSSNEFSEKKEEFLKIEEQLSTGISEEKINNVNDLSPKPVAPTTQEKKIQTNKKIEKGENIYSVLKGYNLSRKEIKKIFHAAKPFSNIKKVSVGTSYSVSYVDGQFESLTYDINLYNTLSIKRNLNNFYAEVIPVVFDTKVQIKEGIIEDSLLNLASAMEESPDFTSNVVDIFDGEIDFVKDIKKGDTLKAAIEKKYRDGNFVEYGKILGAEFISSGNKHTGIYFEENHAYYNPDGEPITKQFLKTPLKFSRISSEFSTNRLHPILKRKMPHFGIDYVAPIGTPVHAVADGIVTFAKRKGPSGKLVYIKHNDIYTTGYSHLNSFAKGIQVGSVVKQGDVIGTVGMTGRATGPHLDYQIRERGTPIDPLQFKSPTVNPIAENQILAFAKVKNEVMALLDSGTIPSLTKVAMR